MEKRFSMENERVILFETDGPVAIITLNRPTKINAMSNVLYDQLAEAGHRYADDDSLLCAIVTGAGGNFSSGGDFKFWEEWYGNEKRREYYEFDGLKVLEDCEKPLIAAVDGYCLASGLNLAVLYCDMCIATTRAVFSTPAVMRGLRMQYPMPFTLHMTLGNAMYMFLTGMKLNAEQALRMGLVSEVVSPENLMTRAKELAKTISEAAPLHIRAHKAFQRNLAKAPGSGQELVNLTMAPLAKAEDTGEGRRSFIEKRKPTYQNK
jgi:enoyl-CoA hydratase/carnithine racemase